MRIGRGKVVVAMSGGVDSSVAACLLHEQGYEVIGLFMRAGSKAPDQTACAPGERPVAERTRGCCSAEDASDARSVAGRLGIPFFALNFKDRFDRIIDYFVDEYQRGRTPNPCVMCNQHLKFGRLLDYANAAGADFVATGHYARIERRNGHCRLLRAKDSVKDQSYVLFGIGRQNLGRTLFPIGEFTKPDVRRHARRFGLPFSEKQESQDICFVPDRDYARLLRERRPEAFQPGSVRDGDGREVGRHQGIAGFTVGQRRGLGLAMGRPVYVTDINARTNTVTIGSRSDLQSHGLMASGMQWLVDIPAEPFRAQVKIRYAHPAAPATVEPIGAERLRVRFDQLQSAVTPGQAVVLYQDGIVLGGGWIDRRQVHET